MEINKKEAVIISGAGLAGALLGCYLAQNGFKVELFERRDDMRVTEMSAGRSINLALSTRGITALKEVGIAENIMEIAIPMRGRMVHSIEGDLNFQPYSKDGLKAIHSVSRGELNCRLMTLAEKNPNIRIHFSQKVDHIDFKAKQIVTLNTNNERKVISGQTILGCDGAFSVIRGAMLHLPRFNYSQEYLNHGYKELTIPPTSDGKHQLEKHALHIWPRGGYMMIALPNLDGSFTVTCFFPFEGEGGFDHLDNSSDEVVLNFFKKNFPDAMQIMPNLVQDWRRNPTSTLITVKCWPWSFEDQCCLFGDAAHAIVPFFGQGMNAAFEDCRVFNECLQRHSTWKQVFQEYESLRKENADAIADMAIENFVEMRDKVADPNFVFLKKVQHLLGKEFPRYLSRYEMVSFSNIPYKEAARCGAITDQIAFDLMKGITDISQIDLKKASQLIETLLPDSKL